MNELLPPVPPSTLSSAPRAPFVFKFWGTLAWTVAALAAMVASGFVVLLSVAAHQGVDWHGSTAELAARFNLAVLSSLNSIVALVPVLATIGLAVRLARQKFDGYLALIWPSRRQLLIGMAAAVGLELVTDTITRVMGWTVTSDFLVEALKRNPAAGMVLLMAASLVVTTPITEEVVFRGFVYRGFAASRLGPVGAVILSSVLFTVLHVQYGVLGLAEVFASGLLLGIVRAVSGSTLVTIAMHAFVNAMALLEAMVEAGLFG